jgi:hypothetical protein
VKYFLRKSLFGPRRGLEGPFEYPNGRVLYYDPRAGEYWDPTTDFLWIMTKSLICKSRSLTPYVVDKWASSKYTRVIVTNKEPKMKDYPNMSYCQCQNTLAALEQIMDEMDEQGATKFLKMLNMDEMRAFDELIHVARQFSKSAATAQGKLIDQNVAEILGEEQ